MPLDFPSNPSDGQVYDNYYYDAAAGVWQSNGGTTLPNIFKNVTYTTAQTYLVPATVKGKLGQTANLQEWTDSAGNVLASIDDEGRMTVQSLVTIEPIAAVPTGSMVPFAGSAAPSLFLLCQGQEVSRSTYSDLFAVIGTTYGAGNGSTTFNLPNPTGRVVAGKASSGTFGTLGSSGGAETVTLTSAQIPAHSHPNTLSDPGHNHSQNAHNHTHRQWIFNGGGSYGGNHYGFGYAGNTGAPQDSGAASSSGEVWYGNFASTATNNANYTGVSINNANNTGGGESHSNLQPYLVTNYIIKT